MIRPGLDEALAAAAGGGVIVVAGLDRLAGRLEDLLQVLHRLETANAHLVALHDGFDTRRVMSAFGMAEILAGFGQRTRLLAARARRSRRGGPPALSNPSMAMALDAYLSEQISLSDAVDQSGVSRATFLRRAAELKGQKFLDSGLRANPC